MKKLILSLLLVAVCMSLFAMEERGIPSSINLTGSGTELAPYLIEDFADLVILSTSSSIWGSGNYFKQTADIDASETQTWSSGQGLSTIGSSSSHFFANYDGQGYEISNLFISRADDFYQGLFGMCNGASIQGINLVNCNVTGKFYTGGLIGQAKGSTSIENCTTMGEVNGYSFVGGLVGYLIESSSISNCHSSASVTGSSTNVGGLVGRIKTLSTISNSYATGLVIGTDNIGGLVGNFNGGESIINSFATGLVEGQDYVGGLVGYISGTNNSNYANIYNCYATGDVEGDEKVGGFSAFLQYTNVNYCYSTGLITANSTPGGFVSLVNTAVCNNSFWDINTSGTTVSEIGTGKTTTEMTSLNTYTAAGWDLLGETANGNDDIWTFNSMLNNSYPYLSFAETYINPPIVCPLVTINSPLNGAINQDLEDTDILWEALPFVYGKELYYHVIIKDKDDNIIYEVDIQDAYVQLEGIITEYSAQYSFQVKPYYVDDSTGEATYPLTEPEYYTFYTYAGVIPEILNENNPVSKVIINSPDGALPSVPVIPAELPTGYPYQVISALTYNFNVPGYYEIDIYSDVLTLELVLGTAHVFINGEEVDYIDPSKDVADGWIPVDIGNIVVSYNYTGTKGDIDIVVTNNEDSTLPVELSSFDAVMTSAKYAQISWQTASEANILGYNIYRAESENQAEALRITATMIQATNYAMGDSYSYLDDEVEMNNTYYYWLQSNDFDGTCQSFGPVTVKISEQEDHDIDNAILGTQLYGNYPNPFNPETTISYSVSKPQVVNIEVFNMKGQLVKTLLNEKVETANSRLKAVWDGRDNNNQSVSSGVYLIRMTSDEFHCTKKAIMMK